MICLTGDVHHLSMKTNDQLYSKSTEVEIAKRYLAIAEKYGVKVTLFITGKTFEEETEGVKGLLQFKNLEIGGHTYRGLKPNMLHWLFKAFTYSYYGPSLYQSVDINRTLHMIRKTIGEQVFSWRTHAYASNSKTYKLVSSYGIKVISDEVRKYAFLPKKVNSLISLPINVIPDHEHLLHKQQKYSVRGLYWLRIFSKYSDEFGSKVYTIEEWFKIVKRQTKKIMEKQGVATILAHPLCMEISDNLKTFSQLCNFLSQFESLFAKEVVRIVD